MCDFEELFAGIITLTLHGNVLLFALWLIIADSEIYRKSNKKTITWLTESFKEIIQQFKGW